MKSGTERADRTEKREKYTCVCCGEMTMDERPPGTHQICPVCGWEDDRAQYRDPDYPGGANKLSLNQARKQHETKSAETASIK